MPNNNNIKDEHSEVFPKYLIVGKDSTVECVGYLDDNSRVKAYSKNKGYILDDIVWIYSDIGKPKNSIYPYFWITDNGEIEFSKLTKQMADVFSIKNLNDLDLSVMVSTLHADEELYDLRIINDMNSSGEKYIPTLSEHDDFLKKLIKACIINKSINLNRLKCRVNEKYVLPNMKAALDNSTRMSVSYFNMWAELLGIDYLMVVFDNGSDSIDPLTKPMILSSQCDEVTPCDETTEALISKLNKDIKERNRLK